jgi:peptidoglycan-associated lipoprotein
MRRVVWLVVALVMVLPGMLFTASCTKKVVQTEPVSVAEPEVRKAPEGPAAEAEQAPGPEGERLWEDVAAREAAERAFLEEKIHFSFDSFILSDHARQILYGKADYLRANPDIAVTVEGHCDDRGTDAYNMALGERRAESVTMFLVNLGINTDRLNTVSYGEEQPIATEDSEASWARNRRAQFAIN